MIRRKFKQNISYFLILGIILLISTVFTYCNKDEVKKRECENPIKVTGTKPNWNNEDIEKWGEFILQLELNKSCYQLNEPILVKASFINTGIKPITVEGIFPLRNFAVPPTLSVYTV